MSVDVTFRSARREIDAAAEYVFDLLAMPAQHHRLDASAMVGDTATPARLAAVGDWRWRYELEPCGSNRARVTLTSLR